MDELFRQFLQAPEPRKATSTLGMASPQDQQFARQARAAVEDTAAYQNLRTILTNPVDQMSDLYAILTGKGGQEEADNIVRRVGEGLMGMAGTFAGPKAKNAPLGALKKAEELKAAGVPDRQIWSETGWTSAFPDGKWRWEIPDNTAKLNIQQNKAYQNEKMSDLYNHPELYANYPEAESMRGSVGWYRGAGDTSEGAGYFTENPVNSRPHIKAEGNTKTQTKGIVGHELQHAVQEREGFAKGGNPSEFEFSKQQPKISARYNEISDEMTKRILETKKADFENDPILVRLMAEKQGYEKSFPELLLSPTTQYRNLAGEAESRLTQKRMDLTPEQRRAQYPIDQFDVPVSQQIVRGLLSE